MPKRNHARQREACLFLATMNVNIHHKTKKAWLVSLVQDEEGKRDPRKADKHWFPCSMMVVRNPIGPGIGQIVCEEWIAVRKGLLPQKVAPVFREVR